MTYDDNNGSGYLLVRHNEHNRILRCSVFISSNQDVQAKTKLLESFDLFLPVDRHGVRLFLNGGMRHRSLILVRLCQIIQIRSPWNIILDPGSIID